MAEIYRFQNRVAVHLGSGNRTVYLLPGEAREIGRAITRAVADIRAVANATNSNFAPKVLDLADPYRDRRD